ncbi:CHAT domain-containing protein [Cystobacter fuscus]
MARAASSTPSTSSTSPRDGICYHVPRTSPRLLRLRPGRPGLRCLTTRSALHPWHPLLLADNSESLERFFSTVRADLASSTWVPLPGSRQEAESIQRLLPQARLFLGPEATKERLLHLSSPGILHVATHGFFLEDAPTAEGARGVGHFGALGDDSQAPRPPSPCCAPASPWRARALRVPTPRPGPAPPW